MMDTNKVAVYGSLLSGLRNHRVLKDSLLIGYGWTVEKFRLIDLGAYPGAVPCQDGSPLRVEVYQVCPEVRKDLDRLEGYPHFYDRAVRNVRMDYHYSAQERAWVYHLSADYPLDPHRIACDDGDWKAHLARRQAAAIRAALTAQARD